MPIVKENDRFYFDKLELYQLSKQLIDIVRGIDLILEDGEGPVEGILGLKTKIIQAQNDVASLEDRVSQLENTTVSVDDKLDLSGGQLTGPLKLARDPIEDLEAATKKYVDTKFTQVSQDIFNLSGYIATLEGNIATTYATLSYVDGALNSKIDKAEKGTPNGVATLDSNGKIPDSQYQDRLNDPSNFLQSGDIVRKLISTTPSGFLRANGAYVDKNLYPSLFSMIGYNFDDSVVVTDFNSELAVGVGQPYKQQYQISPKAGTTGIFTQTGQTIPRTLSHFNLVVTQNKMYLLGGRRYNLSRERSNQDIYVSNVLEDGSLSGFVNHTYNLPQRLYGSSVFMTINRLYLLGGNDNGGRRNTIYYADIDADGNLGPFQNTGDTLPRSLYGAHVVVTKNTVYLLGGVDSTVLDTAYKATINPDGSIGAFTPEINLLPYPVYGGTVLATRNKVYIVGGYTGSTFVNTIIESDIGTDGRITAFNVSGTIPVAMSHSVGFVAGNRAYILGGRNGTNSFSNIYVSDIDSDGNLVGFSDTGSALPVSMSGSDIALVKNKVYMAGNWIVNDASIVSADITKAGLNDYTAFYNGTINKFDGNSIPAGLYSLNDSNPDPNVYFKLPDYTNVDISDSLYSYIKI